MFIRTKNLGREIKRYICTYDPIDTNEEVDFVNLFLFVLYSAHREKNV